jgi:hypothetical protein
VETETGKNITIVKKENRENRLPGLLKGTALLLIVYGITGFIYYFTVVIYSFVNNDFLSNLEYNNFNGNYLYIPLFVDLMIHLAIILSGFLLIYRKKQGTYYYYISYFFTIGFSTFILNRINLPEITLGLIILILIYINRYKFY